MPKASRDVSLDDVQVLGEWNFTLQSDTPLFWIRSGALERYLLKCTVRSTQPSTCGIVFHAEADGPGTDGCSFWIERMGSRTDNGYKRYCVAGDALESKAVVTRNYPDVPAETEEEIQILVQGYSGCIMLQDRKVQIKFRLKQPKGSIAFYNTGQADVCFAKVNITALRRGPLEVTGVLGRREQAMLGMAGREAAAEQDAADRGDVRAGEAAAAEAALGEDTADSPLEVCGEGEGAKGQAGATASTALPSDGTAIGTGFRTTVDASVPASVAFRATVPAAGSSGGARLGAAGQAFTGASDGGAARRTWGQGHQWSTSSNGSGQRGAPKGRMRQSASDSVLRRSGAVCGGISSGTSTARSTGRIRGGRETVPLALNPHRREQELVRDVRRRELDKGSCRDFIAM